MIMSLVPYVSFRAIINYSMMIELGFYVISTTCCSLSLMIMYNIIISKSYKIIPTLFDHLNGCLCYECAATWRICKIQLCEVIAIPHTQVRARVTGYVHAYVRVVKRSKSRVG